MPASLLNMGETWHHLYDDTDTDVESAFAGITRTVLRFIAESKYILLIYLSLQSMNHRADMFVLKVGCGCPKVDGLYFAPDCIADCQARQAEHEFYDNLCVQVMLGFNTLLLLYICFRPSDVLDYGLGKWRASDVSLCYHLNEFYYSDIASTTRVINKVLTFLLIMLDLTRVFGHSESLSIFLDWFLHAIAWIPAWLGVSHLHAPAELLAKTRYKVYMDFISDVHTKRFECSSLLQSAPQVLMSKTTEQAIRNMCEASAQQYGQSKSAPSGLIHVAATDKLDV